MEWISENQIAVGYMNGIIEIWEIDENESKFQVFANLQTDYGELTILPRGN